MMIMVVVVVVLTTIIGKTASTFGLNVVVMINEDDEDIIITAYLSLSRFGVCRLLQTCERSGRSLVFSWLGGDDAVILPMSW